MFPYFSGPNVDTCEKKLQGRDTFFSTQIIFKIHARKWLFNETGTQNQLR